MPSELEVSAGEIPEPSFNFSIPLPHALAVGQDSPLTAHVVEMADRASIQYDAIRNLVSPRLSDNGDSSITDKILHSA